MCLEWIDREKPRPSGIGYKVYRKRGRFLYSEFFSGVRRPTRKWLGARWVEHTTACTDVVRQRYKPTWHILTSLQEAKRWAVEAQKIWFKGGAKYVVRKVKYIGAHTMGKQSRSTIIVANGIYIYPGEVR